MMNKKSPARSLGFLSSAAEYLGPEQIDQAIRICEELLKTEPNRIPGHMILAKCYLAASSFKKARKEFKNVLRLDPNNTAAFCYLAEINQALGQTRLALSNLKRALRLDPLAPGLKDKIDFLEKELESSRHTPAAESALDEDISSRHIRLTTPTLAEIYAAQGCVEKARDIYRQVLEQNPENQQAKQRLIQLEEQLAAQEQPDEQQN